MFYGIEQAGITVEPTLFNEYFNKDSDGIVYTHYNFKTLTTRPSNTYDGINFAALNKENGCRKSFIPRHDKLIEIDIRAYHPTLLSRLVGYDFGNEDIYSHFAEIYKLDRKDAKILTLQQLYGGILPQYKELEFFKKVSAYVDDLWDTFQHQGYIKCPISGFEYHRDKLEKMNPQKLLNYLLQNLETAYNVSILWDVFKILKNKKTKLVLYTYDSFLFDWDATEKDELKAIIEIFNQRKLNIEIKHGTSYDFGLAV
jgi:hypothetical protein